MDNQPGNIPAPLQAIYAALARSHGFHSNQEKLWAEWDGFLPQLKARVPDIHIEADGEIVYIGELSPGCRACKAGTWDCVFTTMRCNLQCEFCYSPQSLALDFSGSAFGSNPAQIADNYSKTHITGISFSGGEPFLEPEKLLDRIAFFRERFPEKYIWIYTNGLRADVTSLRELGLLGVDEIRFNTAATGYTNPIVMQNMALAARFIPTVSIEVPAIPEHAQKLLSSLEEWISCGVKFINLHELLYEPGTLSAAMPGTRLSVCLEDGHRTEVNPNSRLVTLAVMEVVCKKKLSLSINDCSLQGKLRQVRGRRRSLMPLTKKPTEQCAEKETFVSYFAHRNEMEYCFCHPDSVSEFRRLHPDYKIVKVKRLAPLSLGSDEQWISCEDFDQHEPENL